MFNLLVYSSNFQKYKTSSIQINSSTSYTLDFSKNSFCTFNFQQPTIFYWNSTNMKGILSDNKKVSSIIGTFGGAIIKNPTTHYLTFFKQGCNKDNFSQTIHFIVNERIEKCNVISASTLPFNFIPQFSSPSRICGLAISPEPTTIKITGNYPIHSGALYWYSNHHQTVFDSLNSETKTFSSVDPWQFFSAEKYQADKISINVSIPSKTLYKKQLKNKYNIYKLDHILFHSYPFQFFSSFRVILYSIYVIGIFVGSIILIVCLMRIFLKRNNGQTENNSINHAESLSPDILSPVESINSDYIPPVESMNPDFIPPVSSYEPEVDSPITYDRL